MFSTPFKTIITPFLIKKQKKFVSCEKKLIFFKKKKKKKIAPMVVGAAAVAGVTATVVGTMGGNVPNPTHHIYRGNT